MAGCGQKAGVLRFGAFELNLASGDLRKGGALVRLQSQHFELLALLASRPGQVVSREEIPGAIKSSHGAGLCTAGAGAGKIRWQRNWQSVPQPYSCTMKAFPTSGSLAEVPRKRVRDRVETTARKNRRYDRRLPAKQLRPTIQKRYRHKPIP